MFDNIVLDQSAGSGSGAYVDFPGFAIVPRSSRLQRLFASRFPNCICTLAHLSRTPRIVCNRGERGGLQEGGGMCDTIITTTRIDLLNIFEGLSLYSNKFKAYWTHFALGKITGLPRRGTLMASQIRNTSGLPNRQQISRPFKRWQF